MGVLKDFNTAVVKRTQAVGAPTEYNVIRPGVSYTGSCTTAGCDGCGKSVVCNRGMGSVIVNDDIMEARIRCPVCRGPVVLEAINLFRCRAVFKVLQHQEQCTEYAATGDDIVRIGARDAQESFGNALVEITAKPLRGDGCTVS